jgi:hypothetical protein
MITGNQVFIWRNFMKVLTVILGVVVAGSTVLPLAAQENMRKVPNKGALSCLNQGTRKEICFEVDIINKLERSTQGMTLSCQYNSRLRVWQLMQGQNPSTATKTKSGVEAPRDASSGMAAGREVFYTSQTSEECEAVLSLRRARVEVLKSN